MWILKVLAVYLPLEEFFLKWLPVSDMAYQWLRQAPDAIVISFAFSLIAKAMIFGKRFPKIGGWCDAALACFLLSATISLVANPDANFLYWLLNIKAVVRYVLIIYIILALEPTEKEINQVLRCVWYAVVIQVLIGIIQLSGGMAARDFLAARRVTEGVNGMVIDFTGDRFDGVNDLFGTTGNTINYAYLLVVGMVLWLFTTPFNRMKYWIGTIVLFLFIYLTGSRASMLASLLLVFGHQIWVGGWQVLLKKHIIFFVFMPLFFLVCILSFGDSQVVAGDTKSVSSLFTENYLEAALNQRLGVMVYIIPDVLFSFDNLFGFVSVDLVVDFIKNNRPSVPNVLMSVLPLMLDDVYWVALYLYYGLFGFVFLLIFFGSLYNAVRLVNKRATDILTYRLTGIAIFLLVALLPLNFLNQALATRTFSFYLWLFCGLALTRKNVDVSNVRDSY